MPTYRIEYSNFKLSVKKKEILAKEITKVHSRVTGANLYFAQVLFHENKKNNHFMGGKIIKEKQIFLHGQIRSGRTPNIKKNLILKLRDAVNKYSKLKQDNIWVYIVELKPEQMIEYGEILPRSGREKRWFKKLNKNLKKKLKKLDEN